MGWPFFGPRREPHRENGDGSLRGSLRESLVRPRSRVERGSHASSDDEDADEQVPWGTLATSTLSLTMTAVGSVVLSLPAAFAQCGWLAGSLILLAVALLMDASLMFLTGAARSARAGSYEATGATLIGPLGGQLVRWALVVLLFGSLVSLQIIIADLAQPIVETAVLHRNGTAPGNDAAVGGGDGVGGESSDLSWVASRGFITVCSFAAVYPMTLARSVGALGATSSAAFVILIAVAAVLIVRFANDGVVEPSVVATNFEHPTAISLALPVVNTMHVVACARPCLTALSYACHFNIVDIDRELPPGRAKRCMNGIIHTSILGISFPFYLVFAMVGYLQFGADVSGDLLTEWIGDDVMAVAQVAVAGVNVLKYPLVGFGLRRMTEEELRRWFALKRRAVADGSVTDGSRTVLDWREESDDEGSASDVADCAASAETDVPWWAMAIAMFLLHAAAAACAVGLRSLQLALDIIGATCGIFITFVLPGWLFFAAFGGGGGGGACQDGGPGLAWAAIKMRDDEGGHLPSRAKRGWRAVAATLVITGVVCSVCGVVATFNEIF